MILEFRVVQTGFLSGGFRCSADLYLPDIAAASPLVIMAHGFGGERTFRLPGLLSIIPDKAKWDNKVCARILFKFPMYRPLRFASGVKCPALLMLAENDSLVVPDIVRKAARRMPNAQVISYPFGHFDIYHGNGFEDAISKQTSFLRQHLCESLPFSVRTYIRVGFLRSDSYCCTQ